VLESFTMNEIKWSVYEIKGSQNIHFKGEGNKNVYEIVTQEVSLNEVKRLLTTFKKSS
jgi:hypothetical protein